MNNYPDTQTGWLTRVRRVQLRFAFQQEEAVEFLIGLLVGRGGGSDIPASATMRIVYPMPANRAGIFLAGPAAGGGLFRPCGL